MTVATTDADLFIAHNVLKLEGLLLAYTTQVKHLCHKDYRHSENLQNNRKQSSEVHCEN